MTTQRVLLQFPENAIDQPIIYHLVKDFDLIVNIFRAKIDPDDIGHMILDISGEEKQIKEGIQYIHTLGVEVKDNKEGLIWDNRKCTHCGNCLTHCPTQALYIKERSSMEMSFDSSRCIECLNCIGICPFGAVTSIFSKNKVVLRL
ncbi:MAG: 4Fe-4S binding protein [Spirochaetes bacterium]|nr:4Fe-4S binding protein [Spirochaetota bacterium]